MVRPLQLRLGGGWNYLMPELIPKPNLTGGKTKKKKACVINKKIKNKKLHHAFASKKLKTVPRKI
jgi:hypothetical protein